MKSNCFKFSPLLLFLIMLSVSNGCKKDNEDVNMAPWVSIVQPGSGITVASGDTVIIRTEAGDNDGKLKKVMFFMNDQLIATDVTSPYTYTFAEIPEGNYVFTAKAVDNLNNSSFSNKVTVNAIESADEISISVSFDTDTLIWNKETVVTVRAKSVDCDIKRIVFKGDYNVIAFSDDSVLVFKWNPGSGISNNMITIEATDAKNRVAFLNKELDIKYIGKPDVYLDTEYSGSYYYSGYDMEVFFRATSQGFGNFPMKKLKLYLNDSLIAEKSNSDTLIYVINNFPWGEQVLRGVAINIAGDSSFYDIDFDKSPGIPMDGNIKAIVPSDDPQKVYAIDKTNNKLLIINPFSINIEEEFSLPVNDSYSADYSAKNKCLYILSENTGDITVWNENSSQFETHTYSSSADGRCIRVDDNGDRLYIASTEGLYVVSSLDFSVISHNPGINGDKISLMSGKKLLFINNVNWLLEKYDISGDEPQLLQTGDIWGVTKLLASPDEQKVVIVNNKVHIVEAEDITDVDFVFEHNFSCFTYNSTGSIIYFGQNDYSFIIGYSTDFYYQSSVFETGNNGNKTIISLNSDDSRILIFTYGNNYPFNYYLSVFQNN